MKALTVYQPWASLLVAGVKNIETRSWWTGYRELLAIHAAKFSVEQTVDLLGYEEFMRLHNICIDHGLGPINELPRGCILGERWLAECLPVEDVFWGSPEMREPEIALERSLGDWTVGRYAWCFSETRVVFDPPIPWRGQQRLWDLPDGWLVGSAVREATLRGRGAL